MKRRAENFRGTNDHVLTSKAIQSGGANALFSRLFKKQADCGHQDNEIVMGKRGYEIVRCRVCKRVI